MRDGQREGGRERRERRKRGEGRREEGREGGRSKGLGPMAVCRPSYYKTLRSPAKPGNCVPLPFPVLSHYRGILTVPLIHSSQDLPDTRAGMSAG